MSSQYEASVIDPHYDHHEDGKRHYDHDHGDDDDDDLWQQYRAASKSLCQPA